MQLEVYAHASLLTYNGNIYLQLLCLREISDRRIETSTRDWSPVTPFDNMD